jgi:type IV pilus assembly protein PilM
MFNIFNNLFGKKSNSVVGIDIGSSSVKIVQLSRRGGKAILETYGELALGPYGGIEIGRATNLSPEKIAEALQDLMRESKVTTQSSGISIPYGSSLISVIEMPAVSDKQLAQMIPLEARKYIPVPLSEVMLDWWAVPKNVPGNIEFGDIEKKPQKSDKIDILLVAIHNDTLEIEIFSAVRSILDQDTACHMVVDMGAASTKVYIVERGIVRTSHVINRGSQDVTISLSKGLNISMQQAEIMKRDFTQIPENLRTSVAEIISLTLDFIFSDANRVLLNYQKRFSRNVSRVTMVGGGARLEDILKLAESHFQTEVVLGNPFGKTESPAFLEAVLKTTGPEFAVAVGIALRKLQELA